LDLEYHQQKVDQLLEDATVTYIAVVERMAGRFGLDLAFHLPSKVKIGNIMKHHETS
jgi:hypothetical protein